VIVVTGQVEILPDETAKVSAILKKPSMRATCWIGFAGASAGPHYTCRREPYDSVAVLAAMQSTL
jgi:hypothetical protein